MNKVLVMSFTSPYRKPLLMSGLKGKMMVEKRLIDRRVKRKGAGGCRLLLTFVLALTPAQAHK